MFGISPRLASELLTDDALQSTGQQEIEEPSGDTDTAAFEFRRTVRIRDRARQLLSGREATSKIREAGRRTTHVDRQFTQGQWVFVGRRRVGPQSGHGLSLLRDRWIGPGLVMWRICVRFPSF